MLTLLIINKFSPYLVRNLFRIDMQIFAISIMLYETIVNIAIMHNTRPSVEGYIVRAKKNNAKDKVNIKKINLYENFFIKNPFFLNYQNIKLIYSYYYIYYITKIAKNQTR